MANIKIVADNAADRATLTADSTAGTLVATNVQADGKGAVHRATGKSVSYSLAFATPEQVACAAVLGNFSPTTTMRVRVTNEQPATNIVTAPNDFSNAAWAKAGLTVATGVAGPDGALSGSTLTATTNAATLTQTQTVVAGNFTTSLFVRRRTGSGTVSIATSANTAWTPLALTAAWARVKNDGGNTFSTSAVVHLQLATLGDAIDVAFAQLESGAMSSYYPGTRPLGYIDAWQAYAFDSGAIAACSAPAPRLRGFTAQQAASAYAFGGGAYATVWFNSMSATGVRIDIADPNNLQGYVEAWRVIVGDAWSPKYNPDWGAGVTPTDNSKIARLESGDSVTSQGTRGRKLALPLKGMPATDRAALFDILRANGTSWPMLVSLFPGDADKALERDHMLWAKLSTLSAMVAQAWSQFNSSLEFDEA